MYIYMSENSLTMSNLILEVGPMLTSAPWPSPKISVFDKTVSSKWPYSDKCV